MTRSTRRLERTPAQMALVACALRLRLSPLRHDDRPAGAELQGSGGFVQAALMLADVPSMQGEHATIVARGNA